jgi:hypothetical protein
MWYRPARRQLGLARMRVGICSNGAPESEVQELFAALGVPIVSTDTLRGLQLSGPIAP